MWQTGHTQGRQSVMRIGDGAKCENRRAEARALGPLGLDSRPNGPRAGVGFLGRGQLAPPHQLEGLGERCEVRGAAR